MVECWLPYGNTEVYVTVDMKDLLSIAEPARVDPRQHPREIVAKALSEPRGSKRLEELAGPDCTVSIALEGTTAPANAVAVLAPIVTQLVNLIVPRDKITVIIANGVRERSSKDLIKALKASDDLKGVNIVEHTSATTSLSALGETRQKTPVAVNKAYTDAKIKIVAGEVEADCYTGFTGAHTAIIPGLASPATVEAHRKLILKGDVKPGVVEANQVKEDALEAAKMAGCDIAIQLVTNTRGRLLSAFAGALEETWGQAIYALGAGYQINAEVGADIVIVSTGGSKHDYDLYSAAWALQGSTRLVKKGGAIILLAECPEGLGAETFSNLAHVEQQSELERRYAIGAEALQVLKAATTKCQVFLVSSLPKYMVEPLGVSVARTANDAYQKAADGRRGRRTLVIPYGCSTVPVGA
ncbi:MAG: lactate racemase domain-containing protein [Candidatus Bathyarchaeota archaeon]|nr:lactate racemase domain-containing protein [Candidatus Bathyarchaeota archaeon]